MAHPRCLPDSLRFEVRWVNLGLAKLHDFALLPVSCLSENQKVLSDLERHADYIDHFSSFASASKCYHLPTKWQQFNPYPNAQKKF
jgi:hypothetical protein